jgi:GxxExxY protein
MLTDPDDCNQLTHDIIGGVIEVHRRFGPGLLESTYSTCLRIELEARGHTVSVRVPVALEYRGVRIDAAYWIDMLVDDRVILELKAVEALAPVHTAQMLTYLRLTGRVVGLLINFNVPVAKDGIKRIVNRAGCAGRTPAPPASGG